MTDARVDRSPPGAARIRTGATSGPRRPVLLGAVLGGAALERVEAR